jgi:hypothetical protein
VRHRCSVLNEKIEQYAGFCAVAGIFASRRGCDTVGRIFFRFFSYVAPLTSFFSLLKCSDHENNLFSPVLAGADAGFFPSCGFFGGAAGG